MEKDKEALLLKNKIGSHTHSQILIAVIIPVLRHTIDLPGGPNIQILRFPSQEDIATVFLEPPVQRRNDKLS